MEASLDASSHCSSVNANMFASGKYSDLTIICQGERFKVHRAVVCLQSKPLAAAVDGKFKEAITGEIDLDDNDPEVVKKFLEFLYMGNYSDVPGTADNNRANSSVTSLRSSQFLERPDSIARNGAFLLNTKLYIMADRYDVQTLKVVAKRKYKKFVVYAWNYDDFVASLKLMYEETLDSDRSLKNVAVNKAGKNLKVLMERDEFISLCKSNGEIAFDMLKLSVG